MCSEAIGLSALSSSDTSLEGGREGWREGGREREGEGGRKWREGGSGEREGGEGEGGEGSGGREGGKGGRGERKVQHDKNFRSLKFSNQLQLHNNKFHIEPHKAYGVSKFMFTF